MARVKVALLGFGNVGRAFARYITATDDTTVSISAVADSGGAVLLDDPTEIINLIEHKERGRPISEHTYANRMPSAGELIEAVSSLGISTLVECLPTNLVDGQPAIGLIQAALRQGTHVVTVDKGPLVHGFDALKQAEQTGRSRLGFTGTIGVPIPDQLTNERVVEIRGVLNGTTNYILTEMQQGGFTFGQALARAQADGIAEPDPSLDIEGWDTACKILIMAKALMGADAQLSNVSRIGIGPETESLIQTTRAPGRVIRLIGRARTWQGRVRLSVAPELLDPGSPIHSVAGTSKAAVFRTESGEEILSHARSGRDAIAQTILDDIRLLVGGGLGC